MFPPRIDDNSRSALCVCGHDRAVHQHHRAGSDCGIHGRDVCAGFRHATPLAARLLNRVRRPAAAPVVPTPVTAARTPAVERAAVVVAATRALIEPVELVEPVDPAPGLATVYQFSAFQRRERASA